MIPSGRAKASGAATGALRRSPPELGVPACRSHPARQRWSTGSSSTTPLLRRSSSSSAWLRVRCCCSLAGLATAPLVKGSRPRPQLRRRAGRPSPRIRARAAAHVPARPPSCLGARPGIGLEHLLEHPVHFELVAQVGGPALVGREPEQVTVRMSTTPTETKEIPPWGTMSAPPNAPSSTPIAMAALRPVLDVIGTGQDRTRRRCRCDRRGA